MEIIREIGKKGQVVIPKDIREMLRIKDNDKIIFKVKESEVIIKRKDENVDKFLEEFFTIARTKGKDLTLKDLKKIEDESYDLP